MQFETFSIVNVVVMWNRQDLRSVDVWVQMLQQSCLSSKFTMPLRCWACSANLTKWGKAIYTLPSQRRLLRKRIPAWTVLYFCCRYFAQCGLFFDGNLRVFVGSRVVDYFYMEVETEGSCTLNLEWRMFLTLFIWGPHYTNQGSWFNFLKLTNIFWQNDARSFSGPDNATTVEGSDGGHVI